MHSKTSHQTSGPRLEHSTWFPGMAQAHNMHAHNTHTRSHALTHHRTQSTYQENFPLQLQRKTNQSIATSIAQETKGQYPTKTSHNSQQTKAAAHKKPRSSSGDDRAGIHCTPRRGMADLRSLPRSKQYVFLCAISKPYVRLVDLSFPHKVFPKILPAR